MLSSSLKHLAYFIKQYFLGRHPIKQFSTILGVGSYVWNLLQAVSEAGWDHFKISSQPNAPTLVETIRTVYGPASVPTPSSDIEIAVDTSETEEVTFTLVTNQKYKSKCKVPSPLSGTLPDSRSKTSLVSRVSPLPKCYELKFLEFDDRTTLILSNTRELNRKLFYKLVYLI